MTKRYRLLQRLLRKMKDARRPSFIWSFQYLQLKPTPWIAFHRRLCLRSFSTPQSFIFNVVATIRWLSYYAWLTSYKTCRVTARPL